MEERCVSIDVLCLLDGFMQQRPARSTRTDTLLPAETRGRSHGRAGGTGREERAGGGGGRPAPAAKRDGPSCRRGGPGSSAETAPRREPWRRGSYSRN